jgi:hypothetical protein
MRERDEGPHTSKLLRGKRGTPYEQAPTGQARDERIYRPSAAVVCRVSQK